MSASRVEAAGAPLPHHLSDHDRCDRCGSQAYVEVRLATGQLLFCAHHYQEFEVRLRRIATAVVDDRARLHACSRGSAYSSTSP